MCRFRFELLVRKSGQSTTQRKKVSRGTVRSQKADYKKHWLGKNNRATELGKRMNRDDTATAFSKDNRNCNAILEATTRKPKTTKTNNSNGEYTLSKSQCKPSLPTPEGKQQIIKKIRLPSPWLKEAANERHFDCCWRCTPPTFTLTSNLQLCRLNQG